ncbi:hypothetical protein [Nocardia sp. NPDC059239]|uniref:hypothetical protein n=1 Tax=Nocardia sp. NPDC059239 TaxID=3346785 RepID=UPI0036A99907
MVYTWTRWALRGLRGIEPWEAMQVLTGKRPRWPRRGRDAAGAAILTIWGRTAAGRALIVGVYQVDTWDWNVASAREMSAAELAEFTRWEETRDE